MVAGPPVTATAAAAGGCQLGNQAGAIKHVVYLQFDNTHYMRERANVASDLEQMPHLLNFLTSNGTLFTNDHTILISHTAGGIVSTQTGLYPDRHGLGVSNSYFYFPPSKVPAFSSAFKYWTDKVDDTTGLNDPFSNMITDGQRTTPAPWVPFTRAGCDFGAVSLANIELENTGTGPFGDMSEAFGTGSPEWHAAAAANAAPSGTKERAKALTDFVGIAVHCSQGGGICLQNARNVANSRPDRLPDEQGGYADYLALYGAKYVNPAINQGSACVNNTEGQPVTDPFGQCGFPGFDGAFAKNTLGYLAQLKAYDDAFMTFFNRLKADGIDQSNTLFMVTVDEGDQFAGGIGIPQADGTLGYSHTNCSWTTAPTCPANQVGEVNLNLRLKVPAGSPTFSVHSDSAPTFYVNGQPDRTDPTLRQLERNLFGLNSIDPYVSADPAPVFVQMADPIEEKALHFVNSDPARTPSFTGFADPNYFLTAANSVPSCGSNPCIDYHFAWSHGDIQPVIATTWMALVGPGIQQGGIDSATWSDHTNVRPTMLAALGLHDDYLLDGRVLIEALTTKATPQSLIAHRETLRRLGDVYEQVNAPFGEFGLNTLTASTAAISSGTAIDDSHYTAIENQIGGLTAQRDVLAVQIRAALNAAAFDGVPLNEQQAKDWINQAQGLIDQAKQLAASS